ncbi:response regulator transcription factor [Bifidobacterium sp. MA2]|uniref:Response regulator transcription factor n=1 Tax=Bifidobacterium santillanense TaxID=2809028 RepID=A0ABS5UML0_9BIFI|nr:hypothetical protein [Bifidobacterium santillanense]MBT1172108.1 response regulator transcription factor [Bifidobacterium santillanense]
MRLLVAVRNMALSHAIQGALNNARYEVTAIEPKDMAADGPAAKAVTAVFDEESAPFDIAVVDAPGLVAAAKAAQPSVRTLLLAATSLRRNGTSTSGSASLTPDFPATPEATLRLPFSDTELLSYVEMLARESSGAGMGTMLIRGDLTLDLKNRKAYFASTRNAMPLSRLEYDILETLVRASGRFVGLDELQHAAGGSYFTQEGLVRRGVESLDRKLRNAGLIMTKRDGQYRVL